METLYRLTADYHTHTTHSHGKGSVRDNVEQALKKELGCVAISDHGPGHLIYGVRHLKQYLSDIEDAKRDYEGLIEVKASLEMNVSSMDGDWDRLSESEDKFDFLLFGAHECIRTKNPLFFYLTKRWNKVKNTDCFVKCIEKHRPFIVTHPGYGMAVDYIEVAKACSEFGTMFEINNKHRELEPKVLEKVAKTGVILVLSSDAHHPLNVGVTDNALDLVVAADVVSRVYNLERM